MNLTKVEGHLSAMSLTYAVLYLQCMFTSRSFTNEAVWGLRSKYPTSFYRSVGVYMYDAAVDVMENAYTFTDGNDTLVYTIRSDVNTGDVAASCTVYGETLTINGETVLDHVNGKASVCKIAQTYKNDYFNKNMPFLYVLSTSCVLPKVVANMLDFIRYGLIVQSTESECAVSHELTHRWMAEESVSVNEDNATDAVFDIFHAVNRNEAVVYRKVKPLRRYCAMLPNGKYADASIDSVGKEGYLWFCIFMRIAYFVYRRQNTNKMIIKASNVGTGCHLYNTVQIVPVPDDYMDTNAMVGLMKERLGIEVHLGIGPCKGLTR